MAYTLRDMASGIDTAQNRPSAINHRLTEWPPSRDFPIVMDIDGQVVSRYGDARWDLSPWTRRADWANFADGPQRKNAARLSRENADILRALCAWWIYGPQPVRTGSSLLRRIRLLKPLLALCTEEEISASELSRFPNVMDRFLSIVPSSFAEPLLILLHVLYEHRDLLGFHLLDQEGLRRYEAALPHHAAKQTPYIPPRIWGYQVERLKAFLTDYAEHRAQVEACFRFCLDAYQTNADALSVPLENGLPDAALPFSRRAQTRGKHETSKCVFHGSFQEVAERFGVLPLIDRWVAERADDRDTRVFSLSSLLTLATYTGIAYVANFSLMRIEECWSLHRNCLLVDRDAAFGDVYMLRGRTTKLGDDSDARWVTAPTTELAVNVLNSVASLRLEARSRYASFRKNGGDTRYLVQPSYEPWTKGTPKDVGIRHRYPSYQQVALYFPKLFGTEELRITPGDLDVARQINASLSDNFAVGNLWPLAWHQLRRTGAVNMQASGLVSEASIQYQLKHVTRAMTVYYGQGYSSIALQPEARALYLRTMYELLGHEIARLTESRFISPHGEARKNEILRLVAQADARSLAKAAKRGAVSWRETHLGGCTYGGSCEYGGIDNVTRCGGGDGRPPCADALFDKTKERHIEHLGRLLEARLVDAPVESAYQRSLLAQVQAVKNALDVIRSTEGQ